MQRWHGLDAVPTGWGHCVLTIGVFDGVHRGHADIIGRAVAQARQRGVPSVLLTFVPHPSEVVRPGSHPPVLTTIVRRAELVGQLASTSSSPCRSPWSSRSCRPTSSSTAPWSSGCTPRA